MIYYKIHIVLKSLSIKMFQYLNSIKYKYINIQVHVYQNIHLKIIHILKSQQEHLVE